MSDGPDIQRQVNRSLAWVGFASSAVAALDLVSHFLIVALWITPEELGTAIYAVSLFPVLDLATDLGLTAAVIQRDDHTPEKISTLFWLNFGMSLMLAAGLGLGLGPFLAWMYDRPVVASLLAVYGSKLVWQNVYFIPYALMKRELRFKELSIIRIIANFAEFVGKVGFAAAGFGVWCYVAGPLSRVAVTGIGVQLCHPWRPRLVLRLREAMSWLVFGAKASAHKLLFQLYTNVDYHVVGYFFGEQASGLYTNAYMIALEPCRFISEVVSNIAFPAFAKLRVHKDRLLEQFIALSRMNLVVMLGFLGVVFVGAEDIMQVIDESWVPAAPAVRILCAVGVLRGLSFVVPPLLDGTGYPGKTVIYTAVAAVVLPSLFVTSAIVLGDRYGFLSVAYAWAVGYPVAFAVLYAMAMGILEVSLRDIAPRFVGIAVIAVVSTAIAAGFEWVASGLPAAARLAVVAASMTGSFLLLLARFEGISPRSVARAMKD